MSGNRRPAVIAEFIDEYEEKRVVHRDERGRIRMKHNREIVAFELSKATGVVIGAAIREERKRQGLTMVDLATRAGLTPSKQRMREIETGARTGLRLGTLYCLARVLGKEPWDFMPCSQQAFQAANVSPETSTALAVQSNGAKR